MAEKKGKGGEAAASGGGRSRLIFGVVWFFVIFILSLFTQFFHGIDRRWLDFEYKQRGLIEPKANEVLVRIDDESIRKIGQYPWPRRVYGQLIDKLTKLGAKTIAFDIMLSDPSPSAVDDKIFADAVKRSRRVVLSCWTEERKSQINVFDIRWPYGALRKNAAAIGEVNVPTDVDGQVRVVQAYRPVNGVTIPLLGLAALAKSEGRPVEQYFPQLGYNGAVMLNWRGEYHKETAIYNNGEQVPEDVLQNSTDTSNMLMQIYDDFGFPSIPAIEVLNGNQASIETQLEVSHKGKEKPRIKDSIVFVGSTALGAFDHYPSPFSENMPGVLAHMTLIDNILTGSLFSGYAEGLPILIVGVMIALASFYVSRLGPVTGAISAAATLGGWSFLTYELFVHNQLLDWSAPAFAHASTFVILQVQRTMAEAQEKKWIKNTFGQYLSPKVVDILVNDPSKLTLGGEKRDLTIFFLDIAHFTTISEKMDPEALTKFLNQYLTALTDVIMANDGVVDKYIGDCIMAFWNAPLDQPRHRLLACLSAVKCIETMETLNDTILPQGIPERPACRVGLNSGHAVVGNMGSNTRFSYTVIGDEVNLASRLEGANKFFGSKIMASEATFKGQAEEGVVGRPLGKVKVVGKDVPIMVYELLGEKSKLDAKKQKMLDAYLEGLDHFLKRRFEKAQASFERALKLAPGDGPSTLYLKTSQDYAVIPPQKDWDVWALTAK
jgi:adenylate cyclase